MVQLFNWSWVLILKPHLCTIIDFYFNTDWAPSRLLSIELLHRKSYCIYGCCWLYTLSQWSQELLMRLYFQMFNYLCRENLQILKMYFVKHNVLNYSIIMSSCKYQLLLRYIHLSGVKFLYSCVGFILCSASLSADTMGIFQTYSTFKKT